MASVRVIWTGPGSVVVNITTNGSSSTAFSIGGTPISFPYTISSSTTFDTSTLRTYSVSVQYQGTEIATSQGNPRTFECQGDPGATVTFSPTAVASSAGAVTSVVGVAGAVTGAQVAADPALETSYAPHLVPAYAGTRTAAFDWVSSAYNWTAQNTQRLRAAIGRVAAGTGSGEIGFIGDSLMAGSTTSGGTYQVASSWPSFMRSLSPATAAQSADGFIRAGYGTSPTIDPRWVLSGTWTNYASCLGSGAGSPTATLTTTNNGTSASVWYWDYGVFTFTVSMNGASSGAGFLSVTTTNTGLWKRATLTGFTATNNLKVTGPAAAGMYLGGAAIYSPNTLLFHNLAQGGSYAIGSAGAFSSWTDTGNGSPWTLFVASHNIALTKTDPDVIFIGLGTNDLWFNTPTNAQLIAALTTIINAFPNSDIVLVAEPSINPTDLTDAKWTSFVSSLYSLADTLGVPLLDFRNAFGTYAQAVSAGYTVDGTGHNLPFANAMLGRAVARLC